MKVDTTKVTRSQRDRKGLRSRIISRRRAQLGRQATVPKDSQSEPHSDSQGEASADARTDTGYHVADPDSLLSVQKAADFLGMSPAWLYSSDVPFVRIGRRRLYRRVDLLRYAEQRLCPTRTGKGA